MAKKLSGDIFNAALDIAPANKEGQEGSYNPLFNVISIDKTIFEKMVKSGDLTNFLVILFHEGTHALQQFDKENLITTKNQIFDRDSIKYILETNSPEVYNELKIDPNFDVKIDAAIMLFYLEMDVEKEARKMAYLNTKNLLNFYKNTLDLTWLEKNNSINTMKVDEISYYFDAMTSFANQNTNRIEAINNSYERYDEYFAISGDIYQKVQSIIQNMDINKFTDDLVKNKIFTNEFPTYDDIKEDNENFDYEKINKFWNKNGIDLKEIQEIVKKANLKRKIFCNILKNYPIQN